MTWRKTDVNEQRKQLVKDWLAGSHTVVQLARMYGVSERVAHKTLRRFREGGFEGLRDRSRARHTQVCTSSEIVDALVACRRRHPTYGPRKLRRILKTAQPDVEWPAKSTIGSVLGRHGLIGPPRRRRWTAGHGPPCVEATMPNESWSMDFKGQFRLGDGTLCYPFTVTDNASRFILRCKALDGVAFDETWAELVRCFRDHGLPRSIRSDNGPPFGAANLTGLSSMNIRLMRLGITPDLIEPGKPQQNGRHERMHRTLKHETANPPAATKAAQQRRFNRFIETFNNERPHEALDDLTPASVHERSPRELPSRVPVLEYDDGVITRSVRQNGCFKWDAKEYFLSAPLAGERIAFELVEDEIYLIRFMTRPIAVFDKREGKIHPAGTTAKADLCDRSKG